MLIRLFITTVLLLLYSNSHPQEISSPLSTKKDSLEKLLSNSPADSNRVILFLELSNFYSDINFSKSEEFAIKAHELSKKLNYDIGIGRSLSCIANIVRNEGNYKTADSLYAEAENFFTSINKGDRLAGVFLERGNTAFMQGNYWLAGEFYTRSAELFQVLKDTVHHLMAYQNLIVTLGETDNREKAIELGFKTLPVARATTDTLAVYFIMQGLLVNYTNLKKFDSAALYIPPLLEFIPRADYYFASDVYTAISNYHYWQKKWMEALDNIRMAIAANTVIRNRFQLVMLYKNIGQIHYQIGNKDSALYYYTAAMKESIETSQPIARMQTTLMLSEYYAATNNYTNAYRYLHWHIQLKDSTQQSATRNYTAYLEARFENSKKEAAINELELINTQKELTVVKRNRLLLFGGIGAASLLTILSLLYRNSRQKRSLAEKDKKIMDEKITFLENQQQIVSLQSMINGQETERTRIAKDLHDGLGGLFSTVKMHYSTLQTDTPQLTGNPLYKKTQELIGNASEELRRVAHNMMPEVLLKVGLPEALKDMSNNISSGKIVAVTFQSYGMEKRLAHSTEIMLYRIVQELLNNIIKHSSATIAIIQLNRDGNQLSLTVEDNGKGFNTEETAENQSMGISTVKSRVKYLNGQLSIDSQENVGTTVMINILLNDT